MQSPWSPAASLTAAILLFTGATLASAATLATTLATTLTTTLATSTGTEHPAQSVLELSADELASRYDAVTRYTIRRKGKKIGSHVLKFQQQQNNLEVSVESNIKVTVLKVPVFRFRYQGTEIWTDGELVSATGTTIENNERSEVSLQTNNTTSLLQTIDGSEQVNRLLFASNHWNARITASDRMFNTLTGKASDVAIEHLGSDSVDTGSGLVDAQHYRYTKDVQADVWYDAQARWVKLAFKGEDGSLIEYIVD